MNYLLALLSASVLLSQFATGATIVHEGSFTTSTEGWFESGDLMTFHQATNATDEGVLRARNSTVGSANNPETFVNAGTLSIAPGQSWDAIEFRMKQLRDNGGFPGSPQGFAVSGALPTATVIGSRCRNFRGLGLGDIESAPFWSQGKQADGWNALIFDLVGAL